MELSEKHLFHTLTPQTVEEYYCKYLTDFMHSLESSLLHDLVQGLLAVHFHGRVVLFRRHLRLADRCESFGVSDPLAVLDVFYPVRFIFLQGFRCEFLSRLLTPLPFFT